MIEHRDQLGQSIEVGQFAALTYANSRRVYVGKVIKLTAQRVRLAFNNQYEYKGKLHTYATRHLARPEDVVVLNDALPQHLTMAALQQKI